MSMHNLLEYSNNFAKISASSWKYCEDEPNNNIKNSESFKFKSGLTLFMSPDLNLNDSEFFTL